MIMTDSEYESARARIQVAYSPDLLSAAGQTLSELLTQHARSMENADSKVLNWNHPVDNIQSAMQQLNQDLNTDSVDHSLQDRIQKFQELVQLSWIKATIYKTPATSAIRFPHQYHWQVYLTQLRLSQIR